MFSCENVGVECVSMRSQMDWGWQGIRNTRSAPNPYLYQSLAVMAAELKRTEEARRWFMAGTRTLKVGPCTLTLRTDIAHVLARVTASSSDG